MPLNILIVGAGVCGPALAILLQRSNPEHEITIVERFSSLRTSGQQIDLKAQGVPLMEKMGLLESLRQSCVHETGMKLMDTHGTSLMQFGITAAGAKDVGPTLTNEFEFMRGDMIKLFYDTTMQDRANMVKDGKIKGGLTYEFNKTVTSLDQSSGNRVSVTFSDDSIKDYDLVVAADGQASRTRRLTFGEDINSEAFKSLDMHAAYYNIPRLPTEDNMAKIYFGTRSRFTMTRTGDRPLNQVYLFLMRDKERSAKMRELYRQPVAVQKEAWIQHFQDAGWECKRLTEGIEEADDFYSCEIAQIKMPGGQLHQGRVVLLGDAGYCPSPFTGMGTTLSLIGAYVLAGELAQHGEDIPSALHAYTSTMQVPIQQCQELPMPMKWGMYPSSALGIKAMNSMIWTMSCLRIDKLLNWLAHYLPEEKGEWEIPEYPNLKLNADAKIPQ